MDRARFLTGAIVLSLAALLLLLSMSISYAEPVFQPFPTQPGVGEFELTATFIIAGATATDAARQTIAAGGVPLQPIDLTATASAINAVNTQVVDAAQLAAEPPLQQTATLLARRTQSPVPPEVQTQEFFVTETLAASNLQTAQAEVINAAQATVNAATATSTLEDIQIIATREVQAAQTQIQATSLAVQTQVIVTGIHQAQVVFATATQSAQETQETARMEATRTHLYAGLPGSPANELIEFDALDVQDESRLHIFEVNSAAYPQVNLR